MSSIDLDAALAAAKSACCAAMRIVTECYEERHRNSETTGARNTVEYDEKSCSIDLVTKYDKLCEETIIAILKTPGNGCEGFRVMAEESWNAETDSLTDDPTWVIDPIDGTTAFVHGSFDLCVSIGLSVGRVPVVGVVGCPFIDGGELFTAIRGRGAYCNGTPIRASTISDPKRALILLNAPWALGRPLIDAHLQMHRELAALPVNGIRAYGSTAFELCMVASGRAELFIEPGSSAWDVCAAICIVEAAGGIVTAMDGRPYVLDGGYLFIAAGTTEIHRVGTDCAARARFQDAFWEVRGKKPPST